MLLCSVVCAAVLASVVDGKARGTVIVGVSRRYSPALRSAYNLCFY